MNELTRNLTSLLKPKAALIAYIIDKDLRGSEYFLELREIDDQDRMGAAQPVTYEFMNEISRSYTESHNAIPYGLIPRNLLYADVRKGSERYVWYNLPQRRMMYFCKDLGIENAEYNMPGVIYVVEKTHLKIYAFKGSEVPTPQTELFEAPFFNVTGESVCLGSAKMEMPTNVSFERLQECWERRFWLSEFSHLGNRGNPTRSNLVLVTKAARTKEFNLEELKSMKITVKNLLR